MCSNVLEIVLLVLLIQSTVFGNEQPPVKCNADREDETFLKCERVNLDELNKISNKDVYKKLYVYTSGVQKIPPSSIIFRQLEYLKLQGSVVELDNSGLANLTKLKSLEISFTSIEVLKRRALNNLQRLQSLELFSNKLYKIEAEAFNSLTALTTLNLSYNKLKRLDPKLIYHLSHLKTLSLYYNEIEAIPQNFFLKSYSLETVDLGSNPYKIVPPYTFRTEQLVSDAFGARYDSNLKNVRFSYATIPKLEPESLAYLKNVESLSFTQCYLENISRDTFSNMPNLINLNLGTNKLGGKGLAKINFQNLRKLETLKLTLNQLRTFKSHQFKNNPIKSLDLSINKINKITTETFNDTIQLESLDLQINEITKLESFAFQNLKQLRYLDLSFNQIETIEPGTFSLPNLITLSLTRNNISEFLPGTFDVYYPDDSDTTSRLLSLFATSNKIKTISKAAFKPLRNLKILILYHNQIEHLDDDVFETMIQLEKLELNDNNIKTLPERVFEPLKLNLKVLLLSGNHLPDFKSSLITPLERLEEIELSNIGLQSVDEGLFNIPSLKRVVLNYNGIRYLPKDTLHSDDCAVEVLSLFGNRLTFIDPEFFDNTQLKVFRYGNNPWLCQCLDDVLEAMRKNGLDTYERQYSHGNRPTCVIGPNRTVCIKDVSLNDDIFKEYKFNSAKYPVSCVNGDYC